VNRSERLKTRLFNSRYSNLYLINLLCVVLVLIYAALKYTDINADLVFYSTDAKGYKYVADWIFYGSDTNHTIIRPLFYPLILGILLKGGIWAVIICQILMWITAVNLVYLSAKRLFKRRWVPITLSLLVAVNFSLMALSFHALTEVISCLLIACLVYVSAKYDIKSKQFVFYICLILSLSTTVKPVFVPILLVFILLYVLFAFKSIIRGFTFVLLIVLAILPTLGQMCFMYNRHDVFKVSTIGERTIKHYYVARLYSKVHKVEREESLEAIRSTSKREDNALIRNNLTEALGVFFASMDESVRGKPQFTSVPSDKKTFFWKFMRVLNQVLGILFYCGPIVFVMVCFRKIKRRDSALAKLCLLYGVSVAVALSCGFSFYQGDRLFVPFIVIWPISILYGVAQITQNRAFELK